MKDLYFDDIGVFRYILRILNNDIDMYGCVTLDRVKLLMALDYGPLNYTDMRFGWTEKFKEEHVVHPVFRGIWMFKITLPEPKEL